MGQPYVRNIISTTHRKCILYTYSMSTLHTLKHDARSPLSPSLYYYVCVYLSHTHTHSLIGLVHQIRIMLEPFLFGLNTRTITKLGAQTRTEPVPCWWKKGMRFKIEELYCHRMYKKKYKLNGNIQTVYRVRLWSGYFCLSVSVSLSV